MQRLVYALPLLVALLIGGFSWNMLRSGDDPNAIPSVLISKPAPDFALLGVSGLETPGLARADLASDGLTLVNFFASWCGPCRVEHPILTRMVEDQGLRMVGINYKDRPDDAVAWLDELGNPYDRIGADDNGRAAIEFGVTGVPETFLIDAAGTILYREAGPVVGDGLQRLQEAIDQARPAS